MAGLRDILRAIGSLPRRLEGAMYEEEPIFRPRRNTGSMRIPGIGGEDEEFTPDTGEMEEVGKRRTGRPSKFGSFVQNQLPEMIRAGVVAAGSPTPGAVGTAQDIFGALKAVGDDRSRRDMLRYQMERQSEEDAMKRAEFEQSSRLNDARIKDYEAQAQRQAAMANAPSKEQQVATRIAELEKVFGRPLTDREKQTVAGLMQPGYDARPQAAPSRLSGVISQQMARLDPESPTYQQDYGRLEGMYKEALEREQGMKFGEGRKPFQRPILAKEIGAWLAAPDKIAPGSAVPVTGADGKPTGPFKKPAAKSATVPVGQQRLNDQRATDAAVNKLLVANGGDYAKAIAAATASTDPKIVERLDAILTKLRKGTGKSKTASDDTALIEALTGKKATPAKADPLGVR